MAIRSVPRTGPLDAASLAALLAAVLGPRSDGDDGQLVIGIEPGDDHVDLHVAPLPDDDRAGAAGLFGMRADASWCAAAAAFGGRARHMESLEVVGSAAAVVVVDRSAAVASVLHVDGEPVTGSTGDGPGPVVGLTVDALHRMLGLPSPGQAPSAPLMALAVWSQLLILHTIEFGSTSWAEAVGLHPGRPGGRRGACPVDASVETVVEATLRTEGDLDWARMHRRACAGHGPADLSRREVEWMDPTLYGRWVLGGLPDPELAADTLVAHDDERTAHCVLAVASAVLERVGPMNLG